MKTWNRLGYIDNKIKRLLFGFYKLSLTLQYLGEHIWQDIFLVLRSEGLWMQWDYLIYYLSWCLGYSFDTLGQSRPTAGEAWRAGSWARIQFKQVYFGEFSMSCFTPPALSLDGIFSRGPQLTPFTVQEVIIFGPDCNPKNMMEYPQRILEKVKVNHDKTDRGY